MKCPRCQQENPPQAKFCLECGVPLHEAAPVSTSYAELKAQNEELRRTLAESLEQHTATGAILRIIRSSPTDVQPVLDTIAESAARLCASLDAHVFVRAGEVLRHVGHHGSIPTEPTTPLIRGTANGRAVLEGRIVHVLDLQTEADEFPEGSEIARRLGHRTVLIVPLMRDGVAVGAIAVRRMEARLFTERQVGLLQTFADQAVIALQNVRLFVELQERNRQVTEALEQQTATADVLKIISRSTFDLQPVLNTLIQSATRLCGGDKGFIFRRDGDVYRGVADHGTTAEHRDYIHRTPVAPGRDTAVGCAALERRTVHFPDILADPEYRWAEAQRLAHFRTVLAVPMLRESVPIGVFFLWREEVRPFTDKQIELVTTFADQAVIAIENVRLFTETREALERQTATSEILRVISSSPTDVQPVFDAVAASAARLCEAIDAAIFRVDGDALRLVAHQGAIPAHAPFQGPPLVRGTPPGRAVLDGRTIHVTYGQGEDDEYSEGSEIARRFGHRTALCVPLLRAGQAIGVIAVRRTEARPFTDRQVELLETFADQAVIAIENVRLFTELQTRNHELTVALARQTATSEVLEVISGAQTDVQPVFEAIVQNARRLCDASYSSVYRFDGQLVHLIAHNHQTAEAAEVIRRAWPMPLTGDSFVVRAIRENTVVHADSQEAPAASAALIARARALGHRRALVVPMVREGQPIGAIRVSRGEATPFTEQHIALLKTFADQAVIAIENVRLFTELQEKNRALTQAHGQVTEALEQQTATSEILRTIAQAQAEVQPVFDTIVQSAARLCHAANAAVFLTDGRMVYEPANFGGSPEALAATRARFPRPVGMDSTPGIAILTRSVFHVPDTEDPSVIEHLQQSGRLAGFRSAVTVPMLREGEAVGAILVARLTPGPFSDAEVELLKTFADQAVIAVENVRLFRELEARTAALTRSVEQLTALGEVGRAVSSTLDLETVLTTIVSRAVDLSGLDGGVVFEYDEEHQEFVHRAQAETGGALAAVRRATRIRKGEGVVGRTAITLEPVQVSDITAPGAYVSPNRENLIQSGVRAILAVPMVREGQLIGCLGVTRSQTGAFPTETIELLRTFATQSALAIQNARLYHEIEDKSRQLEAASQHKSEFLANMSHELRTPLNAIIGFSEVLSERMFGELNEKQDEYLKDIHASGQHLLSLINDILDLSKIEAGRMELELTDFDLPTAIENALTLVRERAGRRGIALHQAADEALGQIRGDERKIKQVLLNLLSNAIKFTPDGGQIEVRAAVRNGAIEVSVSDTGVGIAPEDQEAIFEEFRQVGTAAKKVEGTGLGLALSRKFIELHGGRIWVQSQVGVGSTFTLTIPVRRGE